MRNDDLYKYLTRICKKRKLAIERLPQLFGFSRSSLYRYMTGMGRMPPKVQAKFIQVLGLSEGEKREFERLVGLSAFDSSMIAARLELDKFVFSQNVAPAPPKTFKFAYHENDTFLRTSDEIYEFIQSLFLQPGASCAIRMINCLEKDIFASVATFIEKLLTTCENVKVEHLLACSEKDHLQNINMLISILPLLKHKNYSVHHSAKFTFYKAGDFFGDTLIIDVSFRDAPAKYFFISFLDDELSTCLATADKNIFMFLLRNYQYFEKRHDASVLDYSSIDMLANNLLQLQQNANHYLLKPNFCYDDIPISVYQSLLARNSASLADIQHGFNNVAGNKAVDLQGLLANLERRIAASHLNQRIDVHSMDGLIELVKTGCLSDHFTFLPPFNNQEVRLIFEYVRDRNRDPNDSYTLLITKEKILQDGHIISAYENIGVLIEYDQNDYKQGIASNLFIKNKILTDIFVDYARNHVPDNHALGVEEATDFLNSLIDSLP